jgi:hypothetical protein
MEVGNMLMALVDQRAMEQNIRKIGDAIECECTYSWLI